MYQEASRQLRSQKNPQSYIYFDVRPENLKLLGENKDKYLNTLGYRNSNYFPSKIPVAQEMIPRTDKWVTQILKAFVFRSKKAITSMKRQCMIQNVTHVTTYQLINT